ncbi:TadE family protein [Ramlibacter sp. 2FC]|uniref:TadE/TadG family type IV pilus assembly protein n=1 Tax=Ramlibacter sp. 2FC TaxID=2502188 RepID=UPI001BB16132|nr:TadE family protein [Ramlibacter sp. 2FC]
MIAMSTRNLPSTQRMHRQRGAAAVELAFVIFVLLLIVAGTIAFGRAFWYADALTKATRDGARLLSTWPVGTVNSAGVIAARDMVISNANAANVNPALVTGNVVVECLNSTFSTVSCVDGTAPNNVRVRISGFSLSLDAWFPFVSASGVIDYGTVGIAPHTTMRYMN